MRLILIRHAESKHNQQKVIAGIHGCTGLTKHGLEQAQILAQRLHVTGELNHCRTMFYSPVLRASQTAQIIAGAIQLDTFIQDDDLCEVNPGLADGLTYQAYAEKFGSFDLVAFPERPFAPGGESWFMFTSRVQQTLDCLANEYKDQTVIAVTHAGFIVAAFLTLFAIPRPGTGSYLSPQYTSLTEWTHSNGVWQLEKYNDALHLVLPISHLQQPKGDV